MNGAKRRGRLQSPAVPNQTFPPSPARASSPSAGTRPTCSPPSPLPTCSKPVYMQLDAADGAPQLHGGGSMYSAVRDGVSAVLKERRDAVAAAAAGGGLHGSPDLLTACKQYLHRFARTLGQSRAEQGRLDGRRLTMDGWMADSWSRTVGWFRIDKEWSNGRRLGKDGGVLEG
eukprot:357758-Chlamydomonas_euryale.AAC.1